MEGTRGGMPQYLLLLLLLLLLDIRNRANHRDSVGEAAGELPSHFEGAVRGFLGIERARQEARTGFKDGCRFVQRWHPQAQ